MNGIKSSLHDSVHFRRKAIIIEKDLQGILPDRETLDRNGLTFKEILLEDTGDGPVRFKYENRRLKARHYLSKGFTGHCLIKNNSIVGDVWYYGQKEDGATRLHNDINLLNIKWNETYAYSFDTFLDPVNRGNNIARALLNNSLFSMKIKGYQKAYGYYWQDNLPAIWNARVLNKFIEVGFISISRFFFLRISHIERLSNGKSGN
jgi:GNAT superfamily N-acetyltransferase